MQLPRSLWKAVAAWAALLGCLLIFIFVLGAKSRESLRDASREAPRTHAPG